MSNHIKTYELIDLLSTPESILNITEIIVKRETRKQIPKGVIASSMACPLAKAFETEIYQAEDIHLKAPAGGVKYKYIEHYILNKFISYFDGKKYPDLISKRGD